MAVPPVALQLLWQGYRDRAMTRKGVRNRTPLPSRVGSSLLQTKPRDDRGRLIEPRAAHVAGAARHHRDVLLAVDAVAHRRRRDRSAEAEAPDLLERIGVVGGETPGVMAGEQEIAAGAQQSGLVRNIELLLGDDLAGAHIDRPQRAVRAGAALLEAAHALADPVAVLVHRRLDRRARRTAFRARHIGDHAARVVGRREERRRAAPPRAQLLAGLGAAHADAGIDLHVLGWIV